MERLLKLLIIHTYIRLKFLNQVFSPRAFILHGNIIFLLDDVIKIHLKEYSSPNEIVHSPHTLKGHL